MQNVEWICVSSVSATVGMSDAESKADKIQSLFYLNVAGYNYLRLIIATIALEVESGGPQVGLLMASTW